MDRALPTDAVKMILELKDRLNRLEQGRPQEPQAVPHTLVLPINASGLHENSTTTHVLVASSRCVFSAQYLHYDILTESATTGGGSVEVRMELSVPGLLVAQTLVADSTILGTQDLYQNSLDLYSLLQGETHLGQELNVDLKIRRVGGTGGNAQGAHRNNLLLRVHDHDFYN